MFQSAPGFWAGRYNSTSYRLAIIGNVSIRSRLLGREIRSYPIWYGTGAKVSIRSRLLGREIRMGIELIINKRKVSIRSRLLGREILGV